MSIHNYSDTLPKLRHLQKNFFLQVKNSFATIVNGLSVLKLFQLSSDDLLFSQHAYSIYKVRKPRKKKFRTYTDIFQRDGRVLCSKEIFIELWAFWRKFLRNFPCIYSDDQPQIKDRINLFFVQPPLQINKDDRPQERFKK